MKHPEYRERTHTLIIEVPLHLAAEFDYNAVEHTLRMVASVSRMAADGALCDDINVSLTENAT